MVHTYFEQGILGIAGLLFLATILFPWRIKKVNQGAVQDGRMLLISLSGICLIATIGSLLDTPSLAALILGAIACYQSLHTRSGDTVDESQSSRHIPSIVHPEF